MGSRIPIQVWPDPCLAMGQTPWDRQSHSFHSATSLMDLGAFERYAFHAGARGASAKMTGMNVVSETGKNSVRLLIPFTRFMLLGAQDEPDTAN